MAPHGVFAAPPDDAGIVAVLSSNSAPYQQAYAGFQRAWESPVPSYVLALSNPRTTAATRVVVAIGGKAALHPYAEQAVLVYCLAPGIKIDEQERPGRLIRIQMSPSLADIVAVLKEVQPELKRLGVLWSGDSIKDYLNENEMSAKLGVEIVSVRVRQIHMLPDHLRALQGRVDAIWLPADAAIVTPTAFETIKTFSLANAIPFYVPSEALVDQGAVASISVPFSEIGSLAARAARQALDKTHASIIYPETMHLTLNLTSAKICKLKLSAAALKRAERIVP